MRALKTSLFLLWSEILFAFFWVMFPYTLGHVIIASHKLIHLNSLGDALSYPAPGYAAMLIPAILLGLNVIGFVLVVQLSLALFGAWLLLSEFDIEPTWKVGLLIVPFIAMLALEQTCAVPTFLLFLAVVMLRKSRYAIAAACLAMCYLFRTEYILWWALLLVDWREQ